MDIFNNTPATDVTVATEAPATANDAAREQKMAEMKAALKATIASDPTYVERLHTMQDSLEVINSLGFGATGGIVVDKSKAERALTQTSTVVGYRIKNVGTEPIKYLTEEFAADADGKYVGTKVEKVLAPGATADISRLWMTALCSEPEFSFRVKNGKIVRGSGSKAKDDPRAELESYYFTFNKESGMQVNDDSVKLNVGEKIGDKWTVKPEFVATFGWLNNPAEGKAPRQKKESQKFSTQDLAANQVRNLVKSML